MLQSGRGAHTDNAISRYVLLPLPSVRYLCSKRTVAEGSTDGAVWTFMMMSIMMVVFAGTKSLDVSQDRNLS